MKIEKEIIYNIVTSEGARIEVSEVELVELFNELKKIVEPMIPGGKYCHVGTVTIAQTPHAKTVGWPISMFPLATYDTKGQNENT